MVTCCECQFEGASSWHWRMHEWVERQRCAVQIRLQECCVFGLTHDRRAGAQADETRTGAAGMGIAVNLPFFTRVNYFITRGFERAE